jgi:photosystem II stability/assembly factor-like uncharacterized protein
MSFELEEIPGYFFAFDIMNDGTTVIATSSVNGKVYKSLDEGESWTEVWEHPNSPDDITVAQCLFIDSRNYIFAKFTSETTVLNEQFWRSMDGGDNFSVILNDVVVHQPVIDEDSEGRLFIASYGELAEVWRSLDGGDTWTKMWDDNVDDDGLTRHMHGLVIDPATDWVYAMEGEGSGDSSVFRSKDAGVTWHKIMTLDGAVNPSWVPMGLTIFQGKFYFGSDLPVADTDYIYRFEDDGVESDHNIVTEQVYSADVYIAFWIRRNPADTRIISGFGNTLVYSSSGDSGSWTVVTLNGGSIMFSHRWSENGWMFAGSALAETNLSHRLRFFVPTIRRADVDDAVPTRWAGTPQKL